MSKTFQTENPVISSHDTIAELQVNSEAHGDTVPIFSSPSSNRIGLATVASSSSNSESLLCLLSSHPACHIIDISITTRSLFFFQKYHVVDIY